MQKEPSKTEAASELALNVIRVETALSRYPVHRLAKKGSISIELHQENDRGETTLRWEVSHNSRYGQPGPLAYKLDTLIVNRRIEEAARPVPRIIRLGSLRDICRELGKNEGTATQDVKKSLFQNAFAGINAKIRYRLVDGTEETIEAAFTRYAVVFTGEKLPDGRHADAVYLVLSDLYMQVINGAKTRPLDYDYLRELPPASQRFYEILSYQMYAALKRNRPRARLTYSEYCTYAPQTRYLDFEHVKKQMYKVHALHRKSGYIEGIEYEATSDREGKADWFIFYTPGPKARAEYRAFTKKGGPVVLEVEAPTPLFDRVEEAGPLEKELIELGVTQTTAAELVKSYPEERIRKQLEQLEWQREKKSRKAPADPAGYLVDAIRKDYAAPKGFESKADRAKREEAKREEERKAAVAARRKREAEAVAEGQRAQIASYLEGLDAEALKRFEGEAIAAGRPELVRMYEQASRQVKTTYLRLLREDHARRVLKLPELAAD
jgi:hypothetical protein